jgi:uncharacterized cupin superfamily protein
MSSVVIGVSAADLQPEPLDPEQIVAGRPEVTHRLVHESGDGRVQRGIWQITPGVVTDTEADEMFVVVTGRATIELLDSGTTMEVGPGDLVVFQDGERTRWTVHETLRKVYQITGGTA